MATVAKTRVKGRQHFLKSRSTIPPIMIVELVRLDGEVREKGDLKLSHQEGRIDRYFHGERRVCGGWWSPSDRREN